MRLPPLNGLRAFEAAARHESFLEAARELNVTPAAVSQQIKGLEDYLGVELFHRLARGVRPSEAAREFLPESSRGFAHFRRALGSLSGQRLAGKLTVAAAHSLATLWLTPRLGGFLDAFPEIEVRLLAVDKPPDLNRDEADLRIPYSRGEFPGLISRPLMPDTIFPVCAPSLLNQRPLRTPGDLKHHVLLQDFEISIGEPAMTWDRWLRDMGLDLAAARRRVEFNNSILVSQAAVEGQGVALGRWSLVGEHLRAGRLVRPLRLSKPSDYSYYTVTSEAGAERARVKAFIRWLEAEVERDLAAQPG